MINSLTTDPHWDLHWQMTNCERFAFASLLERIRPKVSLEIGTYLGGSLQVLSHFSDRVVSVDIDPTVSERLGQSFPNTTFRCGDSKTLLPDVITELNSSEDPVGFVLIDGDHSTEGVQRDIDAVLKLRPQGRMHILMHDSFNPDCREGMRKAAWHSCAHVHYVELDFIPGIYHYEAHDTAEARTMWGGLGCAILLPEKRAGELMIQESQRGLFEAVKRDSRYRFDGKGQMMRQSFCSRVLGRVRRMWPG